LVITAWTVIVLFIVPYLFYFGYLNFLDVSSYAASLVAIAFLFRKDSIKYLETSSRKKTGSTGKKAARWWKYFLLLALALIAYSVSMHIFDPIAKPDVRPGEEYLVYAIAYPAQFLLLYIPISFVAVIISKIFPRYRKLTVTYVLIWTLIPTLLVGGLMIYGGWYDFQQRVSSAADLDAANDLWGLICPPETSDCAAKP